MSDEIIDEIKQFKEALKKFMSSMKKLVVFFERNFKTSHMQIQCVPVPMACEAEVLEVFQVNYSTCGTYTAIQYMLPDVIGKIKLACINKFS